MGLYPAYAHGELLPHMQVPLERSANAEGGWYVVIGTAEGWAQFLSEMGQPAEIWEPVQWQDEILVGALLGVRQGRGHAISISRLDLDGVTARVELALGEPNPEQAASNWVTYPFHLIRVPRSELALGVVTFHFLVEEEQVTERDVDMMGLDIAWIPGPTATYPTPTPVPTTVPEPTATPTPVPNLKVAGTVLEVATDTLRLRIVPAESDWETIELMEGTSIFEGGRPAALSELAPGTAISALGYAREGLPGAGRTMRAAHIDILTPAAESLAFARYRPRIVSLSTLYDGYRLPLDAGQISTTRPLSAALSITQTAVLTRSGFVVVPASYPSFSALYAAGATAPVTTSVAAEVSPYPLYVTADSALHVTQLTLERVWRAVERQHMARELSMLDREMLALCWSRYEAARQAGSAITAVPGRADSQTEAAETALRSAAYFAVGVSILDPEFEVPDALAPQVQAELALISGAQGLAPSPLLDLPGVPEEERQRVDYGLFDLSVHGAPLGIAPGQALDEDLARYYRALIWHQQIALRPEQMVETRLAAFMAYTLDSNSVTRVLWQRLYALLTYAYGRDASYTAPEYAALVAEVETDADPASGPAGHLDQEEWVALRQNLRLLPLPEHPIWTIWADKRPIEREWRLFGLPFSVEQYVFEQTTGEYVGTPDTPRRLPSGIDLSAALGSLEAYRVAAQLGYSDQMGYVDQVDAVRNELSAVPGEYWTQEQHWNWLYVYRSLLGEKNASYPAWMRTTAAKRSAMQAQQGSWTHLLHQAPLAGRGSVVALENRVPEIPLPAPGDLWGYVEPQPEVYARLAALVRQVIDGLEVRLMLESSERELLLDLEDWLIFLQDTARRELVTPSLTEAEYERLGQYGAFVDRMTRASYGVGVDAAIYHEAVVVPLVRANASAGGLTLIEATGTVDEIYVVIERSRQLYLARGGVYAHYEFTWPTAAPLDDATWQAMLAAAEKPGGPSEPGGEPGSEGEPGAASEPWPPRPAWVAGFVVGEKE
jgi:hypothetical protein